MDTNPVKSIPITEEISVGSQKKQPGRWMDAAVEATAEGLRA